MLQMIQRGTTRLIDRWTALHCTVFMFDLSFLLFLNARFSICVSQCKHNNRRDVTTRTRPLIMTRIPGILVIITRERPHVIVIPDLFIFASNITWTHNLGELYRGSNYVIFSKMPPHISLASVSSVSARSIGASSEPLSSSQTPFIFFTVW